MDEIIDLMLAIRERVIIFYHKDTKQFDSRPFSETEQKDISFDSRISYNDTNKIRLPSYEEINHKEIMSFFVKECVEDKATRKQFFNILRRKDYMDLYLDKLHELDLYDEFSELCGDIYFQLYQEWADKNGLSYK